MGESTERYNLYDLTREEQDAFAARHTSVLLLPLRTVSSPEEIVAVEIPQRKGRSSCVRSRRGDCAETTAESLGMRPAFDKGRHDHGWLRPKSPTVRAPWSS